LAARLPAAGPPLPIAVPLKSAIEFPERRTDGGGERQGATAPMPYLIPIRHRVGGRLRVPTLALCGKNALPG
jgi:hypothetical protein